ncbi:hypothetical protein AW168_23935 [Nocardia brasiliensis]|uniref:Uncharacterized protein n=1 Tax=Nocardia brasiliensis (strain ATCC 700358 / HUJEG-1) TaxID=1133849 RepID=K0EZ00_NOCB7|nr:hypothetical protein O3I_036205 [Nocardia brasiliensis ATCC 700358]OCF88078.1 hypothetical protein AW168_23935 [Nocardia brasiliensis]
MHAARLAAGAAAFARPSPAVRWHTIAAARDRSAGSVARHVDRGVRPMRTLYEPAPGQREVGVRT